MKILLLFFISSLFFNCAHTSSVSFIYTGKSNGILENCNCPKNMYGGLLNRLYFFKQNKDSVDLFIDAGDIFSYRKDENINNIICEILPEFNYSAITPGELDLDKISSITDLAISQNISNLKKEIFLDVNGVKICVTGAIDPSFIKYDKNHKIIENVDLNSIINYNKSLKIRSDILIFLSHMEVENERILFMESTDIDVMVSGHSGIRTYETFDNRVYVSPGRNSEYVGILKLIMNKNSKGMYNIEELRNRFHSMHIDSIPEDIGARMLVDSMKSINKIDMKTEKDNDYE